jgi:hypothetical protein
MKQQTFTTRITKPLARSIVNIAGAIVLIMLAVVVLPVVGIIKAWEAIKKHGFGEPNYYDND